MDIEEVLYTVGEGVERLVSVLGRATRNLLKPQKSETPPKFPISSRIIRRRNYTVHEMMSLHLQVVFFLYLAANALAVFFPHALYSLLILGFIYTIYFRWVTHRYGDYLIEPEPYTFFYSVASAIAFFAFLGFVGLRKLGVEVYYYYAYIIAITGLVIIFRYLFKSRYGRDYTYGVVEEVKNDLIRVFVHDDIAANVKPGYYWVPAVPDVEPDRVVKLLIEDRALKGAVPVRVLEVYLESQSSQSSTEPKAETE
ncbi:DUF2101 family protein [Thermococcus sp. Bubb.Bath]|uniref:DUF2101 family protein n=1 Tax=Thermococcus sp. Bubb.Bath TaxID=1638242 RepID=UPI00143AB6A2|nr:DUF2101 family protein [Thermococcus sp. Bubb.Bath]NJF25543.1 DUF2101 domain-containing protein [Thermococcus sp. Bubb.Bath]